MTSPSTQTVLLVEDNDDNLMIYSTILRFAGYRVVEAQDGQAGLAAARAEHPDLILMDVSIPLLNGWEVTRRLKADPETARIPIVAITAHALAGDRETAIAVGCDGYLSKPVDPRVVLGEVKRYLSEARVE